MSLRSGRPRSHFTIRLPWWGWGLLLLGMAGLVVASGGWLLGVVSGRNGTSAQSTVKAPFVDDGQTFSLEMFQPWPGRERVSILLLGVDRRCEEGEANHTDSLMLLSVDPVNLSAFALSIPRDLWVEIPEYGPGRINQAYFLGEAYNYPGGGGALTVATVKNVLDLSVDYYATLDFEGFIKLIDLIGGIDIEVPEAISDPEYPDACYGYDPFSIAAGPQRLNGEEALKYARTRATILGDVDRASRQQQILMAVRDRILRVNMIPQLIVQAPQLWQSFAENVHTNMTLEEAIQLALLAQTIPVDNIDLFVIGYNQVTEQITLDGQQVLVPDEEALHELKSELFAPPQLPTPAIELLPQLMVEENARIAIFNGTSRPGLAADTRDYLLPFGANITLISNADSLDSPTTQILDYGSHPNTAFFLARLLNIPPFNISYGTEPAQDYDVLVILGNDWQVPTPES